MDYAVIKGCSHCRTAQIFVLGNKVHRGKTLYLITVKTTLKRVVYILKSGIVAELRILNSSFDSSAFSIITFAAHQMEYELAWGHLLLEGILKRSLK